MLLNIIKIFIRTYHKNYKYFYINIIDNVKILYSIINNYFILS